MSTTAGDVLDVHTNLYPINLLLDNILFKAAIRICSLSQSHPLHNTIRKAARHSVKHHCSPLHNLLQLAKLSPNNVETISAVRHSPGYVESFNTYICGTKDQALEDTKKIEHLHPVQVFCDGSGFEGGVGAAAVLYVDNHIVKVEHESG